MQLYINHLKVLCVLLLELLIMASDFCTDNIGDLFCFRFLKYPKGACLVATQCTLFTL